METNQKLYDSVSVLEDADTGSVGSPTELVGMSISMVFGCDEIVL